MPLRRTVCGLAAATGLLFGLCACGGDDQTGPPANTPTPTSQTSSVTPTPADPTAAAKAKIMADYEIFVATRSRGFVSNDPTFPYEQVMTGNALTSIKAVMTGAHDIGTRYSGSLRFIKGEVAELNLKANPATATVHACVFDGLKSTSKSGKVAGASAEVSKKDRMVLIGGRWKATETQTLGKDAPGCA